MRDFLVPVLVAAVMLGYFTYRGTLDFPAVIGIAAFLCVAACVPFIARALAGRNRGE